MLEIDKPELQTDGQTDSTSALPPLPKGARTVELSENARTVLKKRYLRRGDENQPLESVEEMFWRVAYNVALPEKQWEGDVLKLAEAYYDLLAAKRFLPNSPTFTGAGTPLGQLAACFVLPISDDMGRDPSGIFQTLRDAALIQQTGGGNGFSFSGLRPRGARVRSSSGEATGPVGFLRVYDRAFGEIAQGGTRRGANMAVLRVDHPDIREFITCKVNENQITNFNISVGVTDAFMHAVRDDTAYDLIAPQTKEVVETVRAREIFDLIVEHAHRNGEPGVLFIDTANRSNPLPKLYELVATNPCGEQWLGPYESCCLGSINLAQHCGEERTVDWEHLRQTVVLSTRFLDDVIDANRFVPAVPQIREAAQKTRRIGLGIMGLADLMYHMGIRYGSEDAQQLASQVMEFIRFHCMLTSIDLAQERGTFPVIKGSIYDPESLHWQPPQVNVAVELDFGRPAIDWGRVEAGLREHGIRNAAQTTIAPTGTIATVAGCEGYGCEPVFALAYIRHVDDNGRDLRLTYTSPAFENALESAGLEQSERETIIQQVMTLGSCQQVEQIPDALRHTFVVSQDVSVEEQVRMQAVLQTFVDNSISKTVNFHKDATREEVARAYMMAWEQGCKGLTVYVTGSRKRVVLETKDSSEPAEAASQPIQLPFWQTGRKARPQRLEGCTYQINTPVGKAFITINEKDGGQPFEVFITTAKAGSETAAVSEAIGRMISYALRTASPVSPRQRLSDIVRQLAGIGGGRPLGFGPNRVLSLPDGLAQALAAYLGDTPHEATKLIGPSQEQYSLRIGDLCAECGAPAVVYEEGCRKCYSCGFSEC